MSWKHSVIRKLDREEVITMRENEQGEVIIIPKKGGKKVKRTYIEETIRLLDLENWKDEN